jgi:hypothetical protein
MKHKTLRFGKGLCVVLGNRRAQAAQLVLAPDKSVGSAKNRHSTFDPWLFVVKGYGSSAHPGTGVSPLPGSDDATTR